MSAPSPRVCASPDCPGLRPSGSSALSDPGEWRIEIRPAALKSLRKVDRRTRDRIASAIQRLPAGDVKRLRGQQRLWRLRVGDWRVIFGRRDEVRVIDVVAVRPRGGAYR